jgi:hypothetical protein
MNTSTNIPDARIRDVRVTHDTLHVDLIDGRTISVPLAWYPRLMKATGAQRKKWEIAGGGYGIHWAEIDEDLSSEGLLRGAQGVIPPINKPPSRRRAASTSIRRVQYDAISRTLVVEFTTGAVYEYYDVPKRVASDFLRAKRRDDFVAARLLPHHKFSQVGPGTARRA